MDEIEEGLNDFDEAEYDITDEDLMEIIIKFVGDNEEDKEESEKKDADELSI